MDLTRKHAAPLKQLGCPTGTVTSYHDGTWLARTWHHEHEALGLGRTQAEALSRANIVLGIFKRRAAHTL